MGHNSVLFITNDAMGEIDKDPAGWWDKAKGELQSAMDGEPREFGFGNHLNGFSAVWNQHADVGGIIAVGGNTATVLSVEMFSWKHDPPTFKSLLSAAAGRLGYGLRKFPEKGLRLSLRHAEKQLQRATHHRAVRRLQATVEHLQILLKE